MGYKIESEALNNLLDSVSKQTGNWNDQLGEVQKALEKLINTEKMAGATSTNIRNYLSTVHVMLWASLVELVNAHSGNCLIYKRDYNTNIDTGLRFNIKSSEYENYQTELSGTRRTAGYVDSSVGYVLRGIKDIFSVSYSDITNVDRAYGNLDKMITDLDENITALENKHYDGDFELSSNLISKVKQFINDQLGNDRSYKTNFSFVDLGSSFMHLYGAYVDVSDDNASKAEKLNGLLKDEQTYREDLAAMIEKEKEDREWIKWVAVGVAVVGSVVLIAVTAGGATPLVCAGVGAAVGVTTAAANSFADNYVENGSLTEGMDWSDFTKNCLIGAVTGAISGYAGAVAAGSSVVKQPIKQAVFKLSSTVAEKGAKGVINTVWETGEAVVAKKPGDEILSVLSENAEAALKDVVVSGATSFVSGFVSAKFSIDPNQKTFGQSLKTGTIENLAKTTTENGTEFLWDVGAAVLDPNSSKNIGSVIKKEGKEFIGDFAEDFVKEEVSVLADAANDGYSKSQEKVKKPKTTKPKTDAEKRSEAYGDMFKKTAKVAVTETAGGFAGGTAKQGLEIAMGDRKALDFEKIWKEDLEGGRKIIESSATELGKEAVDYVIDEKKLEIMLKRKDVDKNGEVDVVVFDKYMVLKEDYDAARAVAGKGSFKDMSAQDILGLPKNAKISEKNMEYRSIKIGDLEKSDYKARKKTNVTKLQESKD